MGNHGNTAAPSAQRLDSPTDGLDLSDLPPIYVLTTHLSTSEQHDVEDTLSNGGAPLTYDIKEANLVLGNIARARRAKSELLWKGVRLEDIAEAKDRDDSESSIESRETKKPKKRRKVKAESQSSSDVKVLNDDNASETEDDTKPSSQIMSQLSLSRVSTSSTVDSTEAVERTESSPPPFDRDSFVGKIKLVKLEWLNDSVKAHKILPMESYIIYTAKLIASDADIPDSSRLKPPRVITTKIPLEENSSLGKIASHAETNSNRYSNRSYRQNRINGLARQDIVGKSFSSSTQLASQDPGHFVTRPIHLLHQTTSEHDEADSSSLPPMPDWVLENKIYACERATPLESPNQDFICELKKIKLARVLTLDEIGVRAYSTSIASLAAYPHPIKSTREILALPGCDQKIAHLFHEWQANDKRIQAVADLEADPALNVLREFYEIWGVGAKTAREFYYDKGWRDLDDIVEHGWKFLSRVQQIGLKYYDEFQVKISRTEVESITATITRHAKLVTDSQIQTVIVGGYRRGKSECGDVDVILSHPDEAMTYNLVDRVVKSLEKEGWITHTLTLNLTNTKRNQEPLPISTATQVGHGFDTLDKALVVWQDPKWPTKSADTATNPKAKNPNTHRRVDIIISPWRTVGCAVAGWTSGTTFQRDLRRYVKHVKGWKFDSSGVRERGTGRWVDLERWTDPLMRCRDWEEAERRVFEGMGLVYREPWDRCTG